MNKVFRSKRSVKESRHSHQPVSPLLRPTSRRHDVSHGTRSAPAIYITRIERPPRPHQTRISRRCPPPHTRLRSTSEKEGVSDHDQTEPADGPARGTKGQGRNERTVRTGASEPSSRFSNRPSGASHLRGTARTRENATRTDCTQKRSCEKGGHTEREKEQKEGEQHGSKRVAHRG